MRKSIQIHPAYTLVEILIVIVILAVVATLGLRGRSNSQQTQTLGPMSYVPPPTAPYSVEQARRAPNEELLWRLTATHLAGMSHEELQSKLVGLIDKEKEPEEYQRITAMTSEELLTLLLDAIQLRRDELKRVNPLLRPSP